MAGEPDLEITVGVRADEVRFDRKPEVRLGAHADAPASAKSTVERTNVPDEVEPGTTYCNVAVRWRFAARLDDPN